MNRAQRAGFVDEMEKISEEWYEHPGTWIIGGGLVAGALLGGGAIVENLRAKKYPESVEEILKRTPVTPAKVSTMVRSHERLAKRKVGVLRTVKDIDRATGEFPGDFFEQQAMAEEVKTLLHGRDNAAAIVGTGKRDFIVLPKKVSALVVGHELGHLADFKGEQPADTPITAHIFKNRYDKYVLNPEQAAWDNVPPSLKKSKDYKEVREKALGTYKGGFHAVRAGILGSAAIGSALVGVGIGARVLAATY